MAKQVRERVQSTQAGTRAQLSRAAGVAKKEHYAERLARWTVVTTRQPFS
jgi:hypothetical protein